MDQNEGPYIFSLLLFFISFFFLLLLRLKTLRAEEIYQQASKCGYRILDFILLRLLLAFSI